MAKIIPLKEIKKEITRRLILHILGPLLEIISRVLIFLGTSAITLGERFSSIIKAPATIFVRLAQVMHYRLGSFFPFNIRDWIKQEFTYGGVTKSPEEVLGVTLIYAILVPIILSLILGVMGVSSQGIFLGMLTAFIFVWGLLIIIIILLVERRTSSIEEILPDVLSMVAQNMIAGMTPYNSLWTAARPEFGPLAEEIQQVARDTLAGSTLENALIDMTKRVKSEKLDRTVRLMIQGMRSGGELPTVLQEIANDMRNEQNLIKRMRAETTSQSMFIVFAILIGAPLLFAASRQFISIFTRIYGKVDVSALGSYTQSGMMTLHPLTISPDFFYWYAIYTLGIAAGFGAMAVSLIRTGKLSPGVTLLPILIFFALLIFLGLDYGLSSFFRDMLAI